MLSFACYIIITSGATAEPDPNSNFCNVKLSHGVSLDLPKKWWVLGKEWNALLDTFSEARLDLTGLAASTPKASKLTLLAIRSMPESTYADIRIDYLNDNSTPESITKMTADELERLDSRSREGMAKILGVDNLIMWGGTKITAIDGAPATVTQYIRHGQNGPVLVWIYLIGLPKNSLVIAVSYRSSEAVIWKTIVDKVLGSVRIDPLARGPANLGIKKQVEPTHVELKLGQLGVISFPSTWENTTSLTGAKHALRSKQNHLMTFSVDCSARDGMTQDALEKLAQSRPDFIYKTVASKFKDTSFHGTRMTSFDGNRAVITSFEWSQSMGSPKVYEVR